MQDKEHRKEKKEKRRDKEKKKKNKDKDRDRDRHNRHHHEHKHDKNKHKEETVSAWLFLSVLVCIMWSVVILVMALTKFTVHFMPESSAQADKPNKKCCTIFMSCPLMSTCNSPSFQITSRVNNAVQFLCCVL